MFGIIDVGDDVNPFPFQFVLAKSKCRNKSPHRQPFQGSLAQHGGPTGPLRFSPPRPPPKCLFPTRKRALPSNSSAEPDQLWLTCNIKIDNERSAKKDKQEKVSIVMKRTVCRLVSKESWYMGYKGVCGIKIDLVLQLIQEKQEKKKGNTIRHPS